MGFHGMVAMVTGSASGIGAAIAKRIQAEGAHVIGADIQASEGLDEQIVIDLSDPESWPQLPNVDILVCSAGVCLTHPFSESGHGSWARTLAVNLVAVAELSRQMIPHMVQKGSGSVITVASISAFLPKVDQVEYGASKAALVSLTRSLAAIYGPLGVRVNSIAPGLIDTPLTQRIAAQRNDDTLAQTISRSPIKRLGGVDEVAGVACFLASEEASYINGQVLNVDGGLLMR